MRINVIKLSPKAKEQGIVKKYSALFRAFLEKNILKRLDKWVKICGEAS